MGFDIYGLNPNNPNNAIKPEQMDWNKKHTEKESNDYFEELDNFQEEVVGSYFRNNVWFWRPLWNFTCVYCDHILTPKDIEYGHSNSGHKISKTKADRIAKKLFRLIADGTADKVEREFALRLAKAQSHNQIIDEELEVINKACFKEHGKLVPANYPEPYKSQWKKTYDKRSWDDSYPFYADNVKEFAKFCINSGGFEIF